jgi:hypothetical protein
VGSHSGNAPRVVSREPVDPAKSPLPAPRLPASVVGESSAAKSDRETRRVAKTGLSDGESHLWNYICSRVDVSLPTPDADGARPLLRQPKARDLNVTKSFLPANLDPKQVAGLIIQVVGEQNPVPCSACRRHGECPFDSCVSLSAEVAEEVSGLLVSSTRACANCLTRKVSSACSLKSRGLAQRNPPKGDTYLGEELLGHRRPARLSRTRSHDDAYGGDEVRFEEVFDKLWQRRFVPLRPSKRLHNGRTPMPRESRVTSDIWNGTPPTEADLRVEDWEMEDGRINTAGECMCIGCCLSLPSLLAWAAT